MILFRSMFVVSVKVADCCCFKDFFFLKCFFSLILFNCMAVAIATVVVDDYADSCSL